MTAARADAPAVVRQSEMTSGSCREPDCASPCDARRTVVAKGKWLVWRPIFNRGRVVRAALPNRCDSGPTGL